MLIFVGDFFLEGDFDVRVSGMWEGDFVGDFEKRFGKFMVEADVPNGGTAKIQKSTAHAGINPAATLSPSWRDVSRLEG